MIPEKQKLKIGISFLLKIGFLFLFTISLTIVYAIPPLLGKHILDPTIINGKQYIFYVPKITGHQFLSTVDFSTGSITVKGVQYENQLLRYDIYNQQLTLKFINQFKAENIIIVSDAWLTNFILNDKKFEVIKGIDKSVKFFQTLGHGDIKLMYAWKKHLMLDATSGQKKYHFTDPIREAYLYRNGEFYKFKGNRSFAKYFGDDLSPVILKHIRQNNIRVKKASDSVMEALIDFCNSIRTK